MPKSNASTNAQSNASPANKSESFRWISSQAEKTPYVTIDAQERLYISVPARKLLGLPAGSYKLIAGYDYANHRIVIAKADVVRVPDVKPYSFDKRSYAYARHFVAKANLRKDLPLHFDYVGKDYANYSQGSFAFQRAGYEAGDK